MAIFGKTPKRYEGKSERGIATTPLLRERVKSILYADDTVLYYFATSVNDLEAKNADLQRIADWLISIKLMLKYHQDESDVGNLAKVEEFEYIGVTFSFDMTRAEHINNISSKINKRLSLLIRIKHILPQSARVLYFNSFVLPLFDYGDMTKLLRLSVVGLYLLPPLMPSIH